MRSVKEMAHQTLSLKHDAAHPEVFDMSDPGTGKTYVRCKAYERRRKKKARCLLVLCPRSLMRSAWFNDFAKFAPALKVVIATAANRDTAFAEQADVYVTNHDAVKELAKKPKAFWSRFSDLVIDESDAYKHHTSQRSKAVAKIVKHFERRALLSATPNGNTIADIWHQVFLLDGGKLLGSSFYAFRQSVCEPKQVTNNPNAIRWTDKDGAEEAVFGLINEIVVRHRFEDCVDIPKTHIYTVEYQLTPKQQKIYDEMEFAQIALLAKTPITAINAAAVTTKLLQISSGAVYDSEDKYHLVDTGRYELLMDLAQARKHPLMLFFWKHQRDLLVKEAEKRDMKYAVLDGNTNDRERNEIVQRYQAGQYDVLLGHPKTVSYGYTLTKGTSIIWPCPTYDGTWWTQANKRQARIGQTEKTEVVVVLAPTTKEAQVYDICTTKDKRAKTLLSLFESTTPMTLATRTARALEGL